MTTRKSKAKAPPEGAKAPKPMIFAEEGQSPEEALAGAIVAPGIRHGHLGQELAKIYVKQETEGGPDLADFVSELDKVIRASAKGDLTFASRTLAAQAMTLDAIFTEMARRMAANMGEYLGATETYARGPSCTSRASKPSGTFTSTKAGRR